MIEARQRGENGAYAIYDGDTPLCTVETIAAALRHYQQSPEGERVP